MKTTALNDIAEINPRGPKTGELAEGQMVDFVPMADVKEDGSMTVTEQKPYAEVAKGYTAFCDGDVLLAKITPCFENNKISLAQVATPYGFGSTEFHVIRPDRKRVDARYLTHLLRTDRVRVAGEKRMTGSAGQRRVPRAFLEELEIPLPPLEEQKRIAAILDQADALRRLRTRALDRLNALGQAIFHEMFGDGSGIVVRHRLGDLTSKIGSGATPRGGDAAYKQAGIPLIRSMNVRDGAFDAKGLAFLDDVQADGLRNVVVRANDVLLNITGASVARVCLAPSELDGARVNQHVAIVRPKGSVLPEFLAAFLLLPQSKSDLLRIAEAGATRQAITKAQIEDYEVPLPPIDVQGQFVQRLAGVTQALTKAQQQLGGLDVLFVSLQHRAFRGEL